MSEYLLSVVGVAFLASIVNSVIPDGKTSGMVKTTMKMLCMVVILTPFAKIISKEPQSFENYFTQSSIKIDESYIEYCSEKAILVAQTQIEKELFHEFGVQAFVEIDWEYEHEDAKTWTNEIKISCVCVSLNENVSSKVQANISEYITNRYGCKAVIEVWN